jgi:hypothetical protein
LRFFFFYKSFGTEDAVKNDDLSPFLRKKSHGHGKGEAQIRKEMMIDIPTRGDRGPE